MSIEEKTYLSEYPFNRLTPKVLAQLAQYWDENAERDLKRMQEWNAIRAEENHLVLGYRGYDRPHGLWFDLIQRTTVNGEEPPAYRKKAAIIREMLDQQLNRVTPEWIKQIAVNPVRELV
jgi:hypothetical protein